MTYIYILHNIYLTVLGSDQMDKLFMNKRQKKLPKVTAKTAQN